MTAFKRLATAGAPTTMSATIRDHAIALQQARFPSSQFGTLSHKGRGSRHRRFIGSLGQATLDGYDPTDPSYSDDSSPDSSPDSSGGTAIDPTTTGEDPTSLYGVDGYDPTTGTQTTVYTNSQQGGGGGAAPTPAAPTPAVPGAPGAPGAPGTMSTGEKVAIGAAVVIALLAVAKKAKAGPRGARGQRGFQRRR